MKILLLILVIINTGLVLAEGDFHENYPYENRCQERCNVLWVNNTSLTESCIKQGCN